MLSAEDNDRLTRVGPGTPMGTLMRRYWQPVGLVAEIPLGGAPLPVRVLGEDLVLFRDDRGRPGLLGRHCPHRGADLTFGRVEDGGLRCLYHGWLFDVDGTCLDQPAEPAHSTFKTKICQRSYPCVERAGMVFAYLGDDEPPLLPAFEFMTVPESQTAVHKVLVECNYLQKKEGNLDPAHLSYLHRFFPGAEESSEPDEDLTENEVLLREIMRRDSRPRIEVEDAAFGVRVYAIRDADEGRNFVKVTNFVLPNISTHGIGLRDGYNVLWHVPIDDVSTWEYDLIFRRTECADEHELEDWQARREAWASPQWIGPDLRPLRNRDNRYLQDREEMRTKTYTGMGFVHFVHDAFATEGMGAIQDRTQESLGYSDRPIIALRNSLFDALDAAAPDVPLVVRDPALNMFPEVQSLEVLVDAHIEWQQYGTVLFDRSAGDH